MLVVALIWGTTFVITKSTLNEIPPLLLALLRFGVASAILLPLVSLRGGLALLPSPLPIGTLAAMGLTGVALYFIGFNVSLVYTSAAAGSLLQATTPALTAALAIAFLGERFSLTRTSGIGLSVLGVALIVLAAESRADAPNPLLGALFMLGSQLSWAIYTTLSKRVQHLSRLAVTAYSSLLGTLFLVPAGAFDLLTRPPLAISAESWLAVLYIGAAASALTYVLWNRALMALDASQAANFLNLVPVVGVVTAALALGEIPTLGQIVGGALVLGGVWLTAR